ncbi:MAG: hypothetical protein B6D78_04755 [gamma proteobacterium symbiont of Ctena orbiculata]|nr:MAG: hypothetical protein B6D78_04755 [gamma proteobacterium symbiont of Ctena orbiculata]PVV27086.1 MAG: hypothetical protein B6D79_04185 [gamma proteobacterium symbiont of Ctena orbiculata]
MSDELYRKWLNDYQTRREGLRQEVMLAGQQMFDIDAAGSMQGNWCTDEARRYARILRMDIKHPFCLVLWSRQFDEKFFLEITEDEEIDLEESRKLLTWKAENFLPRIGRLTLRLDQAGYYTMLLWPQSRPNPPPQPVCVEVPNQLMPPDGVSPAREMNMWFYVFTAAIDLAQAIIVESNYSQVLFEELSSLRKRGLGERVLYFDINDELYRYEDDRRWPLESIGEAVEFAAAQSICEHRPE